jgi:predicted ArsR family transcriptional regulator
VTAVAAGTRRGAILACLADHPDLTAYELRRVIGAASHITDLLRAMEAKAQVVSRTERRPGQGRPVHVWRIAPPGTVPPPRASEAAAIVARRRERDRRATAARRARARGAVSAPAPAVSLRAAACADADPDLFFPSEAEGSEAYRARMAEASAICAGCPVRARCYAAAEARSEQWGVWGGVDFGVRRATAAGRQPSERNTVTAMTDQNIHEAGPGLPGFVALSLQIAREAGL